MIINRPGVFMSRKSVGETQGWGQTAKTPSLAASKAANY